MTHTHAHSHIPPRAAVNRLAISLAITLTFVIVEVIAGGVSNSLALLTDAAHNFTDVLALALTWWALVVALRPAHAGKTYGYHRAGILVALVNSTTLALIAVGIFYEAYQRFLHPPEVDAGLLIWVGVAAVIVNLVTALLVHQGSDHDLNLRSAFLHLMGDVLSTVGAVIAGVIIYFTGANWVDPMVSVLIGFLILWNAWGIIREAVQILMEATPADINVQDLVADLQSLPGVTGVHDLHVWSLNQSLRSLSAHVVVGQMPPDQGAGVRGAINTLLVEKYHIHHATLQLECPGCSGGQTFCNYC